MKKSLLLILAISAITIGCEISSPPILGERCKNAEYYADSNGNMIGDFTDQNDENYQFYQDFHTCPPEYKVCAQDTNGTAYCHPECQTKGDVYCGLGSRCIDPLTDNTHCGAKGWCSSSDKNDDNWQGENCSAQNSQCKNGVCECARHYHFDGTSCKYYVFGPDHCGDYDTKCQDTELCDINDNSDTAECNINCDKTICGTGNTKVCIDPTRNTQYCGADPSTCEGYVTCSEYQICENGACKCKDGYEPDVEPGTCKPICSDRQHIYDGHCEDNDNKNCGSHGVECDTSKVENSTVVSCETGQCLALKCAADYKESNGECLSNTCTNGTIKCSTDKDTGLGKMRTCNGTSWEESTCSGVSCNSDGTNCGKCLNGAIQNCEGNKFERCVTGDWKSENCPEGYVCNTAGTECIQESLPEKDCSGGEEKCTNDTSTHIGTHQTCSEEGKWITETCPNNASCKNNTACGDCKNGTKTCESNVQKTCESGQWSSETCPTGTVCIGNSCSPDPSTSCTNGTTLCTTDDSTKIGSIQTCESGNWSAPSPCPDNNSCKKNATECGSCRDGSQTCRDNASTKIGNHQTCKYGEFVGESCASNGEPVSCNNEGACGECITDQIKCENEDNIGYTTTCIAGTWSTKKSKCTNDNKDVSCKSPTECGDCKTGHQYCAGSQMPQGYYYCSNGLYEGRVCPDNQICEADRCVTSIIAGCTEGAHQCNGNVYQVCRNNVWTDIETCIVKNTVCDETQGCICESGYTSNGAMCCPNKPGAVVNHNNGRSCSYTCNGKNQVFNGEICCPDKSSENADIIPDSSTTCSYKCKLTYYPTNNDATDPKCRICRNATEGSCCADDTYGCCADGIKFNCDGYLNHCCSSNQCTCPMY